MKILYVNWAPLWLGADVGGGVNVYAQHMATVLAARGHTLYSVSAGYAYNFAGGAYLKRGPDYQGVINYEIINAPNICPGYLSHPTPLAELDEPIVEAIFTKLLTDLRPDVVHFNNIEGFSARCVSLAKQAGARVIYSLHNYHPVCNQVYLLHRDKTICEDFQAGARCVDCLHPPAKAKERFKRQLGYHLHLYPEGHLFWGPIHFLQNTVKTVLLWAKLARSLVGVWRERRRLRPQAATALPAVPTATVPTIPDSLLVSPPTPAQQTAGQFYATRRVGMVAAINQADVVLAVSSWVATVYAQMGVETRKLRTLHIGNAIAAVGRQRPPAPRPLATGERPLHLIYLGLASQPKGFPFFLHSLQQLSDAELQRVHLHIYARGAPQFHALIDGLSARLAGLSVHDGYRHQTLPQLLRDMDVGVVPPIWWDNAPQVVFEMLALGVPVIGARIGGIPDFVHHDENGLLFSPGNSAELLTQLRRVIAEPPLCARLRAGITPMKTLAEHADELESLYRSGV